MAARTIRAPRAHWRSDTLTCDCHSASRARRAYRARAARVAAAELAPAQAPNINPGIMLYNTIPTNTEEETLLKQSKTSLKGIVAGAAVTSFILGIVAATAMSPTYTPKQTSLTSTMDQTLSPRAGQTLSPRASHPSPLTPQSSVPNGARRTTRSAKPPTSRARRSRTTTARYPTEPAKDYKQDTLPRPAQSPFLSLSLPSLK